MKYIIGRNKNFWNAIHQANSAPLWNCIVSSSWPVNPKNRKSKLVILVKNDNLFKVIATASGLKYKEMCNCYLHEHQVCDICQGWNKNQKDKK